MYYETAGKGRPLLLIAGLNADNAGWAAVRAKLAENFRVILPDNRASGRSPVPFGKFSIADMADDAVRLLNHLRINRCDVVGHSMGGFIAQDMAVRYPGRVDKLVLEATACASSARNNALFADLADSFSRDKDKEALMRRWSYWLFSPKTFSRKSYVETFIRKASGYPYLQSAAGFKKQVDAVAGFDFRGMIKKIKSETMVIAGADDILISPEESRMLADGIKGSVFEKITGAGHCPHVEAPVVFISKVLRFLGSRERYKQARSVSR